MSPKVGIVVVNWNRCQDLLRMLDSLSAINYENHEVFVAQVAGTSQLIDDFMKEIGEDKIIEVGRSGFTALER